MHEVGQYFADESLEAEDRLRKEELDATTNDKVAALTNVIDQLRSELSELHAHPDRRRALHENLSIEHTRLKGRIDNYRYRIAALLDEKDKLTLIVKDLADDNGRMTKQIEEMGVRLRNDRRDVDRASNL